MPRQGVPENAALGDFSMTDGRIAKGFSGTQAGGLSTDRLAPLLVVLDIDHTLVCSRDQPDGDDYDFSFARGSQEAWVWKRPGLDAFLAWLRQPGIEVAAYTAASEAYAQSVLAPLDPDGSLFKRMLCRGDCVLEPPAKDLTRLNHDLRRVVLVDDSIASFRLQPDNGVPVNPFRHTDVGDAELQRVTNVLEQLVGVEDVRMVLREAFQLRASVNAKILQGVGFGREAHRAIYVAGAGIAAVNGRYVPRRGPPKCGRPVYVHEERPVYRILWSERGGSWVIDDGEAKEYRYAAIGRVDMDVPAGALWTSCEDDTPQPLLSVGHPSGQVMGQCYADYYTTCTGQVPFPTKYCAQPLATSPLAPPTLPATCGTWWSSAPGGQLSVPTSNYEEPGLTYAPWITMAASAGA